MSVCWLTTSGTYLLNHPPFFQGSNSYSLGESEKHVSFYVFPLQVVRCCLEHASSVAKTFLMSDCVVVEIKEPEPVVAGNPMDNSGL